MQPEENAPKNGEATVVSPSQQCPSTPVSFGQAKNNVTTLEHPLYSPDLAPVDFYLFPQLKSAFKRQCICDATDIITCAEEEMNRLSQNGFQECFQNHYSHW